MTAIGTAEVRPTPTDRDNNDAIRRAVRAAEREAIPLAVAAARARAVEIGFAGGLRVGAVVSMAETTPVPFYGPFDVRGTFGPGRFCGDVGRYRIVRGANGRIVRRIRTGTRRLCRVPSRVAASVSVTYAASPAG